MAHLKSAFTTHKARFGHQSESSRKLVTRMASVIQMRSKLRGFLCVLYRQHSKTKRERRKERRKLEDRKKIYAVRQKKKLEFSSKTRQTRLSWLTLQTNEENKICYWNTGYTGKFDPDNPFFFKLKNVLFGKTNLWLCDLKKLFLPDALKITLLV